MKLYTEEELLYIVQSVAEKACANSLPDDYIKREIDYFGSPKLMISESVEELMNDDEVETIELKIEETKHYDK